MLLFTHGIDLSKDIARNCGVIVKVDWVANRITLTSQDPDLIAKAVQRFNKLEEFYVDLSTNQLTSRIVLDYLLSICKQLFV
jgi:hypothetical protein